MRDLRFYERPRERFMHRGSERERERERGREIFSHLQTLRESSETDQREAEIRAMLTGETERH